MSGSLGSSLGKALKTIAQDKIIGAGVAGGAIAGGAIESANGFADGGLLTGIAADINRRISTDMGNR